MPHSEPVNWQPIGAITLIASIIDEALADTREQLLSAPSVEAGDDQHVVFADFVEQPLQHWAMASGAGDFFLEQLSASSVVEAWALQFEVLIFG